MRTMNTHKIRTKRSEPDILTVLLMFTSSLFCSFIIVFYSDEFGRALRISDTRHACSYYFKKCAETVNSFQNSSFASVNNGSAYSNLSAIFRISVLIAVCRLLCIGSCYIYCYELYSQNTEFNVCYFNAEPQTSKKKISFIIKTHLNLLLSFGKVRQSGTDECEEHMRSIRKYSHKACNKGKGRYDIRSGL